MNLATPFISKAKSRTGSKALKVSHGSQKPVDDNKRPLLSEEKYGQLFQNNPLPMWIIDLPSFQFLDVNDAAIRQYGYNREEFLSMTALDIRPEEDKERFLQIDRFQDSGPHATGIWRHLKKDGTIIYAEVGVNEINFRGKAARFVLAYDTTERKKIEEQQILFSSIVNSSDDAIISKTLDGIINSWNRGAEKLFGWSAEEAIGRSLFMIIPTNLWKEESNIIERVKLGESIEHYETERVCKDGTILSVSVAVSPLKDSSGNIIGASKIARDISERKKAEENLQKTRREISDYKFALNESSIVAITDQKGIIKHANDNFCKISKYSREELIGQDHRIINSGQNSKEFIRNLWVTITNGKIWRGELKNKAKDGSLYWVDTTIIPFLDEQGKPYQYVAIRADITQRKQAEEEIGKLNKEIGANERRFRRMIENSTDIVSLMDKNFKSFYRSPSAVRITGWSEEDRTKVDALDLAHPDDLPELEKIMKAVLENPGEAFSVLFRICHKKGHYIWLDGLLANMLHDDAIHAIVANFRDVTENKEAEEKIRVLNDGLELKVIERTTQLESANKELEAFSYSVSHDLRAPLRAINGYAIMVKEDFSEKLDAEAMRRLNLITENSRKMSQLIDDLLVFSRLGRKEGAKDNLPMNNMVEKLVAEAKENLLYTKARFDLHYLPDSKGDLNMTGQVWSNLIANALKYSSHKEEIHIEIGAVENDKDVTYYIRDNGVGFDMKYADKLFGVFQRLHNSEEFEGTGVGLAIVQRIITKNGGKVWAEGKVNEGATFYFTLLK